jgi:hypothetical protein
MSNDFSCDSLPDAHEWRWSQFTWIKCLFSMLFLYNFFFCLRWQRGIFFFENYLKFWFRKLCFFFERFSFSKKISNFSISKIVFFIFEFFPKGLNFSKIGFLSKFIYNFVVRKTFHFRNFWFRKLFFFFSKKLFIFENYFFKFPANII